MTPRQLLIVRLSSIGDIVHALPAAAALAETFPQARIDWVVEKRHAALLEGNPHLHRVLTLDTLGWRKSLASPETWNEMRQGIHELQETPYDAALDFQGLWKSAVVAWFSNAKERYGFAAKDLREPGAAMLYTQKIPRPKQVHVVKENMELVEKLGARSEAWQFPLPRRDEDDAYIDHQLDELGVKDFVIVNPGGGWRTKCWSPENYAALVREWSSRHAEPVFVTGAPSEEPVIQEILAQAGTPSAHYLPTTLVHSSRSRGAQNFSSAATRAPCTSPRRPRLRLSRSSARPTRFVTAPSRRMTSRSRTVAASRIPAAMKSPVIFTAFPSMRC